MRTTPKERRIDADYRARLPPDKWAPKITRPRRWRIRLTCQARFLCNLLCKSAPPLGIHRRPPPAGGGGTLLFAWRWTPTCGNSLVAHRAQSSLSVLHRRSKTLAADPPSPGGGPALVGGGPPSPGGNGPARKLQTDALPPRRFVPFVLHASAFSSFTTNAEPNPNRAAVPTRQQAHPITTDKYRRSLPQCKSN
jgi:hypothetical protein